MKQEKLFRQKRAHVAIMKKEWGLVPKILSGEKKLESRWYLNKTRPWDNIESGDDIYFKNSSEPVSIKAKVKKVLQFENLNPKMVKELLNQFAVDDGLGIEKNKLDQFYQRFKNKNYCIIISLSGAEKIKPFNIYKLGFGAMSAWITVDNIKKIFRPITKTKQRRLL